MERLVLAALLLASLIVQVTRSAPAPAAASVQPTASMAQVDWAPPPPPPMPPMRPRPPGPYWLGLLHGLEVDVDVDLDLDRDLGFLDHLSLDRVVSRQLAAGEQATCPTGSVCSFDCDGGGCKVDCDSGSVCAVSCDGGRCHNACGDGSVCSLDCQGNDCTSTCGDGAVCHAGDGRGHDHTQLRHHHTP